MICDKTYLIHVYLLAVLPKFKYCLMILVLVHVKSI